MEVGERGGATSVEMALLWTVMIGLILAVVQVALLYFAGQLALTAAENGLQAGRAYTPETADGQPTDTITGTAEQAARDFLARAGGTAFTSVSVTATIDRAAADEAAVLLQVRVSGTAMSLIPGVPLTITRDAAGGLERVAP